MIQAPGLTDEYVSFIWNIFIFFVTTDKTTVTFDEFNASFMH